VFVAGRETRHFCSFDCLSEWSIRTSQSAAFCDKRATAPSLCSSVSAQVVVSSVLAAAGTVSVALAVVSERRMQRHRRAGVSYRDVTLRRDGAWRRADLFTDEGLRHQARASRFGVLGAALWVAALAAWITLS
jgi:hypothetical protein